MKMIKQELFTAINTTFDGSLLSAGKEHLSDRTLQRLFIIMYGPMRQILVQFGTQFKKMHI